jgi:hypothetical protein
VHAAAAAVGDPFQLLWSGSGGPAQSLSSLGLDRAALLAAGLPQHAINSLYRALAAHAGQAWYRLGLQCVIRHCAALSGFAAAATAGQACILSLPQWNCSNSASLVPLRLSLHICTMH